MTSKRDKLLCKIHSQHTAAEWKERAAKGPVHLPPIRLGFLCVEDVQFANELYLKLLRKESSLSPIQGSELNAEQWQRMLKKYAAHKSLLDKFKAVVVEVNDIRYSALAVHVLEKLRHKITPAYEKTLVLVESFLVSREALRDEAILLNSMFVAGCGEIPTLCQLPQHPTTTDIRNILVKSILETFPLLLKTPVQSVMTDAEFIQLCQNETIIACLVRQGKELLDAYVKITGKKNKFIAEQMFWSQFTIITGLPVAQIRAISQKYDQEDLKQLKKRGQQLLDGPATALYICTKLREDISEDMLHKLDNFWRFRASLCTTIDL